MKPYIVKYLLKTRNVHLVVKPSIFNPSLLARNTTHKSEGHPSSGSWSPAVITINITDKRALNPQFSHGFPIGFALFSYDFPKVFLGFPLFPFYDPMVLLWFSLFSYDVHRVFPIFPTGSLGPKPRRPGGPPFDRAEGGFRGAALPDHHPGAEPWQRYWDPPIFSGNLKVFADWIDSIPYPLVN